MRPFLPAVLLLSSLPLWAQDVPTASASGRALIDREIRARWADLDLKGGGRADDAESMRRVHLDITGTIPTAEEAARFLESRAADKREKLVESLLAGDRYAQHWAETWARSLVGYEGDRGVIAVGVVARAIKPFFEKNVPLSELAREIITASGKLEQENRKDMMAAMEDVEPAAGLSLFYWRVQQQSQNDFPLALANRFSRLFLGTQIACAQCHDHPFDKWTQEDFYGMAAFFTETYARRLKKDGDDYGFEVGDARRLKIRRQDALKIPGSNKPAVTASFIETKEKPKDGELLRVEFVRMLTAKSNVQFARAGANRVWSHFFGRGIVNPPDDFSGKNKPTHPELLEALAADFQAHGYDVKWLIREICASEAYQATSKTKKRETEMEKYGAVSSVRALTPEQIMNSMTTAALTDPKLLQPQVRMQVLRQFRYAFGDDEGAEIVEFQGTIPGALLMMNSEIIARATDADGPGAGKAFRKLAGRGMGGSRIGQILKENRSDEDRLKAVFLAALSRYPTERDTARYLPYVRKQGDEGFEDVFWTLLNSSEFLFNH